MSISKFLKESVDYSETDKIKQSILKPILEKYNSVILSQNDIKKMITADEHVSYIINNNIKYYLLIVPKVNNKNTCHTFYFFPGQHQYQHQQKQYHITDFYMEIDYMPFFSNNVYLFEGYLYNQSSFYITDILYYQNNIIQDEYILRYNLINEIMFDNISQLQNLNACININIHPILQSTSHFSIFQNNFIFKSELVGIKTIYHYKLLKYYTNDTLVSNDSKNIKKKIVKGKYSDVYHVYNKDTLNDEGILYIKTLRESKMLISLFDNILDDHIILECEYNIQYKKWKPLL